MFQQRALCLGRRFFLALVTCALLIGCERDTVAHDPRDAHSAPARAGAIPSAVSLVPAATDLILGMGAGDHLVAVSNWDPERAETARLPRVGDYRTQDWEQIARLRPHLMIVQIDEQKMSPGLQRRAGSMNIKLLNVKINRLKDVFTAMRTLGEALNEPSKASDAEKRLRDQLDAVRSRVAGKPPVRTLIVRTPSGLDVVGGGNFMDELLTLAGGANVLPGGENSFPSIDRELLLSLNPDVVLQVLPGATPQEIDQARQFWKTVPQISAVKNDRVYILTEGHLLLPGYSVGSVAELFAEKLHAHDTNPKSEIRNPKEIEDPKSKVQNDSTAGDAA